MARIIRPWLDALPDHVLFGSDAGPFGPGMGWEEVRDGAITPDRAKVIASAVLRDNAVALYQLK